MLSHVHHMRLHAHATRSYKRQAIESPIRRFNEGTTTMCTLCDNQADAKPAKAAPKLGKESPIPTHEALIARIHAIALTHPSLTKEDKILLKRVKLTYGSGPDGVRGVTYYRLWQSGNTTKKKNPDSAPQYAPFVAICATGQSDHIQVLGTTLHELGHVIAGHKAAHGPEWHAACARLGLIGIQAAGTAYSWENFDSYMLPLMKRLPKPKDGAPVNGAALPPGLAPGIGLPVFKVKSCTFGRGSRGGTSRGRGAGSRQLKYSCGCTIVRASAGAQLSATCKKCGRDFVLDGDSLPPSAKLQTVALATGKPAPTGAGKPKGGAKPPKPPKAQAKAQAKPTGRPSAPKGAAAAARSAAVNAPLPVETTTVVRTTKIEGPDHLLAVLNRIDPKD